MAEASSICLVNPGWRFSPLGEAKDVVQGGPRSPVLSGAMGRLKMAENNWVCLGSPLATDKGPPCSKLLRSYTPKKLLWNPKSEGLEDMTPFESDDFQVPC